MRRFCIWVVLISLGISALPACACTTAVISGSATEDGRPLLWKNRDSSKRQNLLVYASDGRYPFVGLANGDDPAGFQIWAGVNSAGFAIMNSASYNIETADTQDEGRFMRFALQSCANLEDFQALLARTDGKARDTSANFGVIDAHGGAAYFEVGRNGFKRFDASDPKEAPGGVLLRTNYSASGDAKLGTGFWRMRRTKRLAEGIEKSGKIDLGSLLKLLARDIGNDAIGSEPMENRTADSPRWAFTGDSICRYDTVSCAVVAGVKAGEDPLLSTFWAIPGQPLAGAALPLWVAAGSVPAPLSGAAGAVSVAKACEALCDLLYPDTRGELVRYMDAGSLCGKLADLPLFLLKLEGNTLEAVASKMDVWRKASPGPDEVRKFQEEMAISTLGVMEILVEKYTGTAPLENPRKAAKPGVAKPAPAPAPKVGCGT
jgi:hypothetical protein